MPADAIPQLTLEDLRATAPSGTVPMTEFKLGEAFELSWASTGTLFKVYAGDQATPAYEGTKPTCTLPGLTKTTTLVVEALLAGPEQKVEGFNQLCLYEAITLTVSNPALTPSSIETGKLEVSGTATVTGDLDVEGNASATSGEVGDLVVRTSLEMLHAVGAKPGSFRPKCDGLIVGTIPAQGPNRAYVLLSAASSIATAYATGGASVVAGSEMGPNQNSLVLPVKKGEAVTLTSSNDGGNAGSFQWFAFGSETQLEEISAEEAAELGVTPAPTPTLVDQSGDPEPLIADLLTLLEEVAAEPLDEGAKRRFAAAVRDLAMPPHLAGR